MNYNVLTEPWIPARLPDGSIREYGVLDLLEHAHELVEITDAMPNYEFGMYRFLFVFLMDAYHPKRQRDIRALLEEGSFDMELIRGYVEECNRDGERFDLLDETHPFMQQAEGWGEKTEEKSSANLNPVMPSGNNHVHFDHTLESRTVMTLKEAAKALCAVNLFSTAGVQGYPSTPSGAPPIYTIVKGDNLFQTLLLGTVPCNMFEQYDQPCPVWRYNENITPKEKIAATSLLFGLQFPCRRVRIICKDGQVSSVLYEQGMNYENYEAWTDPFVTYTQGKKGRSNLKPNLDKENWRNLDAILNTEDGGAYVIGQADNITENNALTLITYSAVTNQMNYLDLQRGEYLVPRSIVESRSCYDFMCKLLQTTEEEGKQLSGNLFQLQKAFNRVDGATSSERTRAMERFYFRCRQAFFTEMDRIEEISTEDFSQMQDSWGDLLKSIRWSEYNQFVDRLGGDSRMYLTAEMMKKQLIRKEEK